MPRQSRSRSSSRPAAAPAAPAQSRGAHTATAPAGHAPSHAPAPPASATQQGPGMFASMAATAGSVAAGSVIGHGISSMLFGGGSAPAEGQAPPVQQQSSVQQQSGSCVFEAKEFTQCIDANNPDCSWYLEQLKACTDAASRYRG